MDRKSLTFEQAEGVEALPTQLRPKEVSDQLRSLLWVVLTDLIAKDIVSRPNQVAGQTLYFPDSRPWGKILKDKHVFRDFKPIDEFNSDAKFQTEQLKNLIWHGNYISIFGTLQWFLRHPACPKSLMKGVEYALKESRSAYRIIDQDTIVPIGSDEEKNAIANAFADLETSGLKGAKAHLRQASEKMSLGQYADSVRESISAVESIVKISAPENKLSDALTELEKNTHMHKSMKLAFEKLYGYASDEKGVRHSLLQEGDSQVEEEDATFMLGACASFITYLVSKGRATGLVGGEP